MLEIDISRYTKADKKVTSAHQEAVNNILDFLGEDVSQFGKWCGMLKRAGYTPSDVHAVMKKVKAEAKNPRALFVWMVKNKKK